MYTMILSYNINIRMTRIKLENYNGIYSSNFLFITDHRNKLSFFYSSSSVNFGLKTRNGPDYNPAKILENNQSCITPENNPGNQANWRNYTRIITHCWEGDY